LSLRKRRSTGRTARLAFVWPPGWSRPLGDHGHARAALRRALERGNLVVAENEAREVGQLDLSEALELTALFALHDRQRGARYAVRWLQRWLEETKGPPIEDAAMVVACLAALGGTGHELALNALRAVCTDLSTERPVR
jgi:hypothetical protein